MKRRVFFSHPYSNAPLLNLMRIEFILKELMEKYKDVVFISPVHTFSYFNEEKEEYRKYILDICKDMIGISDEVWVAGFSSGCIIEIKTALELDVPIKIYYGEGRITDMNEDVLKRTIDRYEKNDRLYVYKDVDRKIKEEGLNIHDILKNYRGDKIYSYEFLKDM